MDELEKIYKEQLLDNIDVRRELNLLFSDKENYGILKLDFLNADHSQFQDEWKPQKTNSVEYP